MPLFGAVGGAELHPSFLLIDNDLLIDGKTSIDAVASTNLDFALRSLGVQTIALAGQLTNICIESTMRSAFDKGYKVIGITEPPVPSDWINIRSRSSITGRYFHVRRLTLTS